MAQCTKEEITPKNKEEINLNTDDEKISYALGQDISANLEGLIKKGIKLDSNILTQSIKDKLNNKKSLMTDEEIKRTFADLQNKINKEQVEKNKKNGEEYLAKNKKAKGVTTTKSGLQYKVIKKGTGKKPKKNSEVKVHYEGKLINGSVFDSSIKRGKPINFKVNRVISGWTEALQLMPKGSTWELTIPSNLAYGEKGGPRIPPHSVLIFEVELLDIIEDKKDKKN